ncbi:MAG: hypothetical protein KC516_03560 [Nanoarchaeota archaeon]|nr:hypothetical protein [Nanoarchaeota archaeon]
MRRLDYKEQLVDYFKRNLKKGYPSDSLKFSLISQGYSRVAVEQAFTKANQELAEKAPPFKEKPVIIHQILDENDNPVHVKRSFWSKLKELFK